MDRIHRSLTGKRCVKWDQGEASFLLVKNKRKLIEATKKRSFEVNKTIKFR